MKQKTIMIVNDSPLFVNMMVEVLSKQDYNCVRAYSSDEAFHIYFDKKPDLVLMDIFMPSRNGIECTKDGIECKVHMKIYVRSFNKLNDFNEVRRNGLSRDT